MAVDPFPVYRADQMARKLSTSAAGPRWLVRDLWTAQGVGFLAGCPKSMKTWMGLELAVSIASATPCLGHFPVERSGPVLLYLAEDRLGQIHQRLAAICRHRCLELDSLDLHFILTPGLQLDLADDRARLMATVAKVQPRLLVLDPLVRVYGADENSAQEISAILGFLRQLQRKHRTAILLVHHFTKRSQSRLGQALRGSGDLWAWSDDCAYLQRNNDRLRLTVEHRAAPAPEPIELRLATDPEHDSDTTHLEIIDPADPSTPTDTDHPPLDQRIIAALRNSDRPLTRNELRKTLHVNNQRLGDVLVELERDGRVLRTTAGWKLPPKP